MNEISLADVRERRVCAKGGEREEDLSHKQVSLSNEIVTCLRVLRCYNNERHAKTNRKNAKTTKCVQTANIENRDGKLRKFPM